MGPQQLERATRRGVFIGVVQGTCCVLIVVGLIAGLLLAKLRADVRRPYTAKETCLMNQKRIATAICLYSYDAGDKYLPNLEACQAFIGSRLECPTGAQYQYDTRLALTARPWLRDPLAVVWEGTNGSLAFPHFGECHVAFDDGSVHSLRPEQAQNPDIWLPGKQ